MVTQHAGTAQAMPSGGGYRLGGETPVHPTYTPPAAQQTPQAAGALVGGSGKSSGPKPADAAAVAQLQDMGPWPREVIEKALLETGNSVPNALDWYACHRCTRVYAAAGCLRTALSRSHQLDRGSAEALRLLPPLRQKPSRLTLCKLTLVPVRLLQPLPQWPL